MFSLGHVARAAKVVAVWIILLFFVSVVLEFVKTLILTRHLQSEPNLPNLQMSMVSPQNTTATLGKYASYTHTHQEQPTSVRKLV